MCNIASQNDIHKIWLWLSYRVGQSREIWTAPRHRTGRLPSYPTAALAASARRVNFPNTRSGASAVPKHDSRNEPNSDEPNARNTFDILPRIINPVINNELILSWIWNRSLNCSIRTLHENTWKSHWRSSPTVNRRACDVTNGRIWALLSKQNCINWSVKELIDHHNRIIHLSLWHIYIYIYPFIYFLLPPPTANIVF